MENRETAEYLDEKGNKVVIFKDLAEKLKASGVELKPFKEPKAKEEAK